MSKYITSSARIRPAAIPVWEALQVALIETVPDCEGDDRYITDPADLPREERTVMAQICAACPLHTPCIDYAATDRPRAGWWPGLNLSPSLEKGTPRV